MKAINFFVLNIILITIFVSCKPKDQEKNNLHQTTKDYFEVRDGSTFIFTEKSDTNISIPYVSSNFLNSSSNPDIENSEFLIYDLKSDGQVSFNIRAQAGGSEYNDQIALVSTVNDSIFIGPVLFNVGGFFKGGMNSGDSVFQLPNYSLNNQMFTDVIRVKLYNKMRYKEVYFAKNLGLIGRLDKNDKLYYVKRYSLK
jgi:hypothetical protein